MSRTSPLFLQTDLITYSGNPTRALETSRTIAKIAFVAKLDGSVVYRPGADYVVSGGQLKPNYHGTMPQLPAGSALLVGYLYPGTAPAKAYDYQIAHVLSYGQSLSLGERAVRSYSTDLSVLTTTRSFDNLMFAGGTRPQSVSGDTTADYAALVPLVESNDASNPTQLAAYNIGTPGETPLSGMFDWIQAEAALEGSAGCQFLGSCPGRGGTAIAGLSSGQAPYTRLLLEVTKGKTLATAAGKTYGVPAVLWMQGEADPGNLSYLSSLAVLFVALNADIKAITGQSKDVQFFMYQTATADYPAWSQYALQKAVSNVHIASPHYHLPKADGTHLTAASSRALGAYCGRAIKRQVIDGVGFAALQPVSWSFSGGNIVLTTNSTAGLALDAAGGAGAPNYGFSLQNASATPVAINAVAITGANQLTITPASAASAGFTLFYGGAAGGVRDYQGFVDRAGGVTTDVPLHKWMATFKQVL